MIKLPTVELLATELAKGHTPVSLFEEYKDAITKLDPPPSAEDLPKIHAELKARIAFAWPAARAQSIKNRAKKPA